MRIIYFILISFVLAEPIIDLDAFRTGSRLVIDCVVFRNQINTLLTRLEQLVDIVDIFLILQPSHNILGENNIVQLPYENPRLQKVYSKILVFTGQVERKLNESATLLLYNSFDGIFQSFMNWRCDDLIIFNELEDIISVELLHILKQLSIPLTDHNPSTDSNHCSLQTLPGGITRPYSLAFDVYFRTLECKSDSIKFGGVVVNYGAYSGLLYDSTEKILVNNVYSLFSKITENLHPNGKRLLFFEDDATIIKYMREFNENIPFTDIKAVMDSKQWSKLTGIEDWDHCQAGDIYSNEAKIVGGRRKIIDCFTFYNEFEMLEFRLEELWNVVDYFVLVEATETFGGVSKELHFNRWKAKLGKYLSKIVHVIAHDTPKYNGKDENWYREAFQRNYIDVGLRLISDLKCDDIIMISDVDEIPNVDILEFVRNIDVDIISNERISSSPYCNSISQPGGLVGVFRIAMQFFYYSLDCPLPVPWYHPLIMNYASYSLYIYGNDMLSCYQNGRMVNSPDCSVAIRYWHNKSLPSLDAVRSDFPNFHYSFATPVLAGWHFSYFGGAKLIANKIAHFSHQELNTDEFNNYEKILQRITSGKDLFNRKEYQCLEDAVTLLPKRVDMLEKFVKESIFENNTSNGSLESKRKTGRLIVEGFVFHGELEMLYKHLKVLYSSIDYFIIVEGSLTNFGQSKNYVYEDYKHLFEEFHDKIIYVKEKIPAFGKSTKFVDAQMNNAIDVGLRSIGNWRCDDVIIISDVNNFLHPDLLWFLKSTIAVIVDERPHISSSGYCNDYSYPGGVMNIYRLSLDEFYYNFSCASISENFETVFMNYASYASAVYGNLLDVRCTQNITEVFSVNPSFDWKSCDINYHKNNPGIVSIDNLRQLDSVILPIFGGVRVSYFFSVDDIVTHMRNFGHLPWANATYANSERIISLINNNLYPLDSESPKYCSSDLDKIANISYLLEDNIFYSYKLKLNKSFEQLLDLKEVDTPNFSNQEFSPSEVYDFIDYSATEVVYADVRFMQLDNPKEHELRTNPACHIDPIPIKYKIRILSALFESIVCNIFDDANREISLKCLMKLKDDTVSIILVLLDDGEIKGKVGITQAVFYKMREFLLGEFTKRYLFDELGILKPLTSNMFPSSLVSINSTSVIQFDLLKLMNVYNDILEMEIAFNVKLCAGVKFSSFVVETLSPAAGDPFRLREKVVNNSHLVDEHFHNYRRNVGNISKKFKNYEIFDYLQVSDNTKITKPMVFCGVYTMKLNKDRLNAVLLSWGWKCDGLIAYSTENEDSYIIDLTHEGEESHSNMWQKIRSIWVHIARHYIDKFDYFYLVGDDAYAFVENIYALLSSEVVKELRKNESGVFMGHALQMPKASSYDQRVTHPPTRFAVGGPGYILDRKALKILSGRIKMSYLESSHSLNCDKNNSSSCSLSLNVIANPFYETFCRPEAHAPYEDVLTAECFLSNYDNDIYKPANGNSEGLQNILSQSVPLYSPTDTLGRHLFHLFSPFWHYNYRILYDYPQDWWDNMHPESERVKGGLDCCSPYSVAFHYMTPNDIWELVEHIYYKNSSHVQP